MSRVKLFSGLVLHAERGMLLARIGTLTLDAGAPGSEVTPGRGGVAERAFFARKRKCGRR